jgi:hypothetical protein
MIDKINVLIHTLELFKKKNLFELLNISYYSLNHNTVIYSYLTLTQLKCLCKQRRINSTGNKNELAERLKHIRL